MASKTLYVGNLPYSITEGDLNTAFTTYGGNNARIIEGRGFGFVDIDADQLDTAIADKHNSQMEGRTLTVNEAKPKENRSSSGTNDSYGGKSRGQRW